MSNYNPAWDDKVRRSGIFATDIPKVLNISKWQSAYSLWRYKVGMDEQEDLSDNKHVKAGHIMEPVIGKWFSDTTGKVIRRRSKTIWNKDIKHFGCHLDFYLPEEKAVLEIKNVNQYNVEIWDALQDVTDLGEDNPFRGIEELQDYYFQVQWQLAVTGFQHAYLAVCIGGWDFRYFTIKANPSIKKFMFNKGSEFWLKVKKNEEPELIKLDDVDLKYNGNREDKTIKADEKALELSLHLKKLKADKKEVESEISITAAEIKMFMKDNKYLVDRSGEQLNQIIEYDMTKARSGKWIKANKPELYDQLTETRHVTQLR